MLIVLASTWRHGRTTGLALVGLVALLAAGAVALAGPGGPSRPVKVLTRNLYLGADLAPAIAAQDPVELALAASTIWFDLQATDFPARAAALAAEIQDAQPHLIGLQEVVLWRTGAPDGPPAFGGSPAEIVAVDFLQSLLDELRARGLHYEPVVVQLEADLEAPTALGFDLRLTQRDAILADTSAAADELTLMNVQAASFANNLTFPIAGGLTTVTSTRGWTSVDAVVNRRALRFVNTHLEAFSNFFRTAQAFELLAGPLATTLPVVLVGDLNSAPDDPVFSEPGSPFNATNPYDVLSSIGLADTWLLANASDPGFTCCNDADLLNPAPALYARYDHVLAHPAVRVYRSRLVGIDGDDRTLTGLWPSDHAGVAAAVAP